MQVGLQALKQPEEMDPLTDPPLDTIRPFPSSLRPVQGGQSCKGGRNGVRIQSVLGLAEPGNLLPLCTPTGPCGDPNSGEGGSAPTLVLGSGSEQQPKAAWSVRPPHAGCGSAMAALLFHDGGPGRVAAAHTPPSPWAASPSDRVAPRRGAGGR